MTHVAFFVCISFRGFLLLRIKHLRAVSQEMSYKLERSFESSILSLFSPSIVTSLLSFSWFAVSSWQPGAAVAEAALRSRYYQTQRGYQEEKRA